ncbi:MAG TPA: GNAT family N-acetyltransferase [candidate division Zixibacteria bacterium]|nr:GNAT family N-acetyltransferase [candidate division Zixibacteria bacterium]HOY59526.1 GNAT family N-acetyltransferase [Verrucomicrobiota bacterium]MDD4916545.1 GNAT family N-acetyltransferase [candidate division Zixibacteria bacterium]MDM7974243.1 GNAT family N-acetyltransferase [candidate division Zixibacteria bacterium]HOD66089.1 GNAT family N-acetyltransferase [candidate division Zixibacteria bacterium]
MEIAPLTIAGLEFRLREEPGIEREWFTARLRDYLAYEPGGCFALAEGGETVGMVTALCYQTTAWLGWLYVAAARRGAGLGERLMRQGMGYCIARGMRSIVLEAVVEAAPLYRRIGFQRQFRTQHYRLEKTRRGAAPSPSVAVRRFAADDLVRIADLDRRMFGQDRRRVLDLVRRNPLHRGWLAEKEGKVAGYLWATKAAANRQAGPWVIDPGTGDAAETAAALCDAAFAESDRPLILRCPLVTESRARLWDDLGAQAIDYHTERMYAGEEYAPEGEGVLCLGCPGKG